MGIRDAWRALFQRENAPKTRPLKGEFGYAGNKIFSGLPMDEYNPDLAFPKSVEVYDQMRRSDGQIAAVLMAMKLPIRSTKWYVEPAEDAENEAQAKDIAQFIEDNLMRGMKYSWDDHLREALLMLDFGFSVFERVFRFDTWNERPVVMLDKYAPRVAPSIWRFPQDEQGNIVAVEQLNYYTGNLFTIPLEKCRLYTYNREGDNPVGMSVLRQAYKHWYYKDNLYKVMAVGVEKSLVGTPYAKMPSGASEEDKQAVLNVLTAIRTAEEAGFTIPEKVELDILEGKKNAVDAMPLMEHHDTMIARSVLAQFINLGTMSSASGGAYALGREMVDMFVMGLESIANYIQGEVQKDIEQLVEWNFGSDAPVPQLKHKDITFRDMVQAATALGALGSGHLIMPDEGMENYLREMFGIPPIPQDALTNQRYLPPNRYVPDIVPDRRFTPEEMQAIQRQQQSGQDKASMSEKVFTFADDGSDGSGGEKPTRTDQEWKRDLTEYESADALRRLNKAWQQTEKRWQATLQAQQKQAAQEIVDQVRHVVMQRMTKLNQMNAVNHIEVPAPMQQDYQRQIESLLTEAYQTGADSASRELGAESPTVVDAEALALIQAKARLLAGVQLGDLAARVKFAVIDQLTRDVAENEIVQAAKQAAASYVEAGDLKVSGMISIGEALNIGRGMTARAKGVQGAQWSSVLDDHTCPLCAELDGKVISVNNEDFDLFRPPLHPGCRCFLAFIGNGQTDIEYTWKTPDASLVKRYGKLVR